MTNNINAINILRTQASFGIFYCLKYAITVSLVRTCFSKMVINVIFRQCPISQKES
jgi:hypothetical protein